MIDLYEAPNAKINDKDEANEEELIRLKRLAIGQKIILYAIALYLIIVLLRNFFGPAVYLIVVLSLAMSLVGVYNVLSALKVPLPFRIITFILLVLPYINLILLCVLNFKATKILREAGFSVGVFGAKLP